MGIPTEYLKKVFDPFFRYQNKINHSSGFDFGEAGMRMGLTIIKKYIDQLKEKSGLRINMNMKKEKKIL